MRLSGIIYHYLREVATNWPELQFNSPDGRSFSYIDDSINSIVLRIQARGHVLPLWERVQLADIRGAIVELNTFDPAMVYRKREELVDAWLELHESFDVELSQQEWETLGLAE